MKKPLFAPILTTAGLVVAASLNVVHAQDEWERSSFQKRFYLGVGGGASELQPDTSRVPTVDVIEESDAAVNVTLGMDFSRRLSAELQYVDLGTAGLTDGAEIDYSEVSLSGLYYVWNASSPDPYDDADGLDLRSGFSLYGRAGFGQMINEARGVLYERENDIQFLLGAGVEYGLSNGLAARAEYTAYDTDSKYLGFSLLYRTGGRYSDIDYLEIEEDLPVLPPPQPLGELPPPPVPEELPAPGPLPELPADIAPLVNTDEDGDGVDNVLDACPDTSVGTPVNAQGCELFNGVLDGVNFETGSDSLTGPARQILQGVVATLASYPTVRVSIHAHTDNQGDEDLNLELSKNRALSVVRFLTAQGVRLDRLQARAYGESQPIADNSTREGRLMNRRVEFRTVR